MSETETTVNVQNRTFILKFKDCLQSVIQTLKTRYNFLLCILSMLDRRIHLCPSYIKQVTGVGSPDVLQYESLQITLTVPEVVDTESMATSILPLPS